MRDNGGKIPDQPVVVSEQQLIDCARNFDNNGCNGGLPSHAFEYIRYQNGIETEEDYPYEEGSGGDHPNRSCRFRPSASKITIPGGSVNITFQDESDLLSSLVQNGPISIAFQVLPEFRFYKSGVYHNATCGQGPDDVNHAVLAVGYGTCATTGLPYWIVKNSWSNRWGKDGYFRISRGNNMCGLADCASYPDLFGHLPQLETTGKLYPREFVWIQPE